MIPIICTYILHKEWKQRPNFNGVFTNSMWYNNLDTQPRKNMTIGKEDTPDLMIWGKTLILQWRHSDRDGVPNQQPHGCFLNRLIRWQKTPKFRVTGLCAGNSPVTGGFPVDFPHKELISWKVFPPDDVIIYILDLNQSVSLPIITHRRDGNRPWFKFFGWYLNVLS